MARTKKHALIQFSDTDHNQSLLRVTKPIHQMYCDRYGIEFINTPDALVHDENRRWNKINIILEAANRGYEKLIWLDANCLISDQDFDISGVSSFGIAACECFDSPSMPRHLNTGVIFFTNSREVRDFLSLWERSIRSDNPMQDQDIFVDLMQSRPHRDLLTILPNRFNCVEIHMEARDPFIRHFPGHSEGLAKIASLISRL